jgi:translocation and assembly module TamB
MSRVRKLSIKKSLVIGLPLLLLILVSAAAIWLLASRSGASWLWNQLEDAAAGSLNTSRVEGDLASGVVIHGLQYYSQDVELTIGRVEIQARPGVWPLSIQVQKMLLQDVGIISRSSASQVHNESFNLDIGSIIEPIKLPLPLEAHHIELNHILFQKNDESPIVFADSMRFQLRLDEQMEIEQLVFSSAIVEATAQAKLGLESPFELAVSLDGQYEMENIPDEQALSLPLSLKVSGDLERLEFQLDSSHMGLEVGGKLLKPFTGLEWDISGSLQELPQVMDMAGQEIALSGLGLASQGSTRKWSVELTTGLDIVNQQTVTLAVSATGSESGIQINHSTVNGAGIDLGISGKLDWSPEVNADLHAIINQLDLSPWLQDWPAAGHLQGELDIDWSAAGLKIPTGRVSVSGTGFEANISANIDLPKDQVNARLDWRHLSWPLNSATPVFNSPSGQLNINGNVDLWAAEGSLELQLGQYPQGRFQLKGNGDRTSSRIELLDGDILGGSLSGMADADWGNGIKWSVDFLAKGVDPEPLIPGWPGQLDIDFGIKSDSQAERLQVSIESFQGMLRGTRIDARGGVDIVEENIRFDQLEFRTDDAILQLNGNATEPAGVTAKFSGQLPSMLLQGASGRVQMDGRFSSHVDQPLLELQMQGLDLAWNELDIKALAVNTVEIDSKNPIPAFDLNATELLWKDELINEISLSLSPDGERNILKASLASELLDLTATIDLAPENVEIFWRSPWSGVLDDLNVVINQTFNFELTEPSALDWDAGSLLLESTCLRDTSGAGLCVGLDHQANSNLSLIADITALPIDYLRDFFEIDVKFEQMLEGHLEWHQPSGQPPTGGADFRITAGRILDPVNNEHLLETSAGVFGFVLRDGNLESGVVDIGFPDVGFIDIDFDVLDIAQDGDRKLKGRAVSQLEDIKQIGQLAFPGVDDAGGQLVSNISLGGTLADPAFEGGFELTNGFFYYAPIGLKLEDIDLTGKLDRRDQGSLKGQFKAGDGIGSIDGRFVFENIDSLEMNLALSGDQLLLVNTESLKVLAETELEVGLNPVRIDINGHIRIPSAYLTPANLLLNTVSDSEDLVIEKRGNEEAVIEADELAQHQVFGKLEVSFGEDVNVKVPGIETSLSGSVLYNWSGDPVPIADGSYVLKGKVDVYGPTLEISNGSISFPGVPANNPLLNIRAQRDIFGNTQIRSAGVQLIGTLKRPVLEAYTVPITNEDRAWILLVTGSDFDQGQGVGGFDVGTYIAPKLYVSYGISLFEDENVISARYDLKKGFGIKVTSGQRETGLDVSYTIEQ